MTEEDQAPRADGLPSGIYTEEVIIEGKNVPKSVGDAAVRVEGVYAIAGLVVGVVVIVAGVVLIALGSTGTVDISFASGNTSGKLTTSVVGVVVALIGAAIIWFTRARITIRQSPRSGSG